MSTVYPGNTVLLMHMDGEDGSQIFIEETGLTTTPTTPSLTTVNKKIGNSGGYFPQNGIVTINNSGHINLLNNDWTIECWFWCTVRSGTLRAVTKSGSFSVGILPGGLSISVPIIVLSQDGTTNNTYQFNSVHNRRWTYYAFQRKENLLECYVDGIKEINTYDISGLTIYSSNNNVHIGNPYGYLDEIRVSQGVARYTTNFTPPTTPFERYL
jgi:hypothetical protein